MIINPKDTKRQTELWDDYESLADSTTFRAVCLPRGQPQRTRSVTPAGGGARRTKPNYVRDRHWKNAIFQMVAGNEESYIRQTALWPTDLSFPT